MAAPVASHTSADDAFLSNMPGDCEMPLIETPRRHKHCSQLHNPQNSKLEILNSNRGLYLLHMHYISAEGQTKSYNPQLSLGWLNEPIFGFSNRCNNATMDKSAKQSSTYGNATRTKARSIKNAKLVLRVTVRFFRIFTAETLIAFPKVQIEMLHGYFYLHGIKTTGMNLKLFGRLHISYFIACLICMVQPVRAQVIDQAKLAKAYYQDDAQWYLDNIPFFECSDQQIEQVYYYRWKLYKAHIRNVGQNEYVITEFINDVTWDRDPYSTINAATMHHIYEGRWLKDDRYMNGYINYMFQQGGNNRSYSESVADAAYARYLVNADADFVVKQLDSMKQSYDKWIDHFEAAKNLYFIPAMPDATEYTIASVDASGGKAGFDSGEAFRPTINSYMYGNAMAIARIAAMKGDDATKNTYLQRAESLKRNIEESLWNDSLQHFADRFKQDNQYVHYWNFIRGRELAGMIPWYFNLPDDNPKYNKAWKHVLDTTQLFGQYGLRTNEPSYEYYFKQFVIYMGQRGSQWNGPSWPYQTSQVITGMANFLNNYKQDVVANSDYVKLLRLFTKQHYLPNGKLDLVENYDPDLGGPIVYYYWSNHYNHSSYNNLVISGLCGIRPSDNDTLDINPLTDNSINYFCLDGMSYHGHRLTVVYDHDGSKYKFGKGLTVFVDGKKGNLIKDNNKYRVVIGAPVLKAISMAPKNYALNIRRKDYPVPSASINTMPDTSLYQAVDGRIWYFSEITNWWTSEGSNSKTDWYAIDFGVTHKLSSVKLYLFADDRTFAVPDGITVDYQNGGEWLPVKLKEDYDKKLKGNTVNTIAFDKITANKIKINFRHTKMQVAISEIECY